MRVVIVFQTTYGNNRSIAEHMARGLTGLGVEVDVHNVYDVLPQELTGADLYVFSAPTHIHRAPRKIRSFLKRFASISDEVSYALVATKLPDGGGSPNTRTLEMMSSILLAKGHHEMGSLYIVSNDMKGPLEEGWESKTDGFVAELMSRM